MKTPVKAIRAHCIWCMCGSYKEVRYCQSIDCALHPYRMGHRPTYCDSAEKYQASQQLFSTTDRASMDTPHVPDGENSLAGEIVNGQNE